eukprot:CAMPEP_0117072852 /NCGR_PEP_ID=MMETSP0472-20121206/51289_1 /TAXON_ID=693140 ORGANISM="Tiarina fusus, Strain LIS" /NCGR_SAMPLE_ID=MMETSP0472 /ASSEMBLY_ACC=CAM_ASM_000603 /LENGTH=195 /DNA_ID=CAMNT_0004797149 /DNA_START=143 /DNA_END=730 /DNA_ORIENTATION=+
MKPVEMIKECYDAGQKHFGENYVAQLIEKAPELPDDISWHFIGAIQSNKVKQIVSVPNLFMVESVERAKIATALNKEIENIQRKEPLRVLVQVNPAGEETKSGVSSNESLIELVDHIQEKCKNLRFSGLMVIGRPGVLKDMDMMKDYKTVLLEKFPNLKELNPFELSMGMSGDYEEAIQRGSTNVRVGSTIFGAR